MEKFSRRRFLTTAAITRNKGRKCRPAGRFFLGLSLAVPFGGKSSIQGRRKAAPWENPFSEDGIGARAFCEGNLRTKNACQAGAGEIPAPAFWRRYPHFTVEKCPCTDRRNRPSAGSGKIEKIIFRKVAIASAKCRTDGARRGKNISDPQSRFPSRRGQWIPRGQCGGGRLQGADR